MLSVDEKDIDRITEIFYLLLKGKTPPPVQLPEDYPDNEIRQLTEYMNRFLAEYQHATRLTEQLSAGELDYEAPRGGTKFFHALKNLQANFRHLTWKTQQIAKGDFEHEVDFMGDFSTAFNRMTQQLKESFEALKKREAEAVELMKAIEAAKEDAVAATKAKSDFLANMSHEIRTPMNAVLGFLELTLEEELSDRQKENLLTAHQSAKSLLSLINDILDLSKLESGRMELEKRTFELSGLIKEVLKVFEAKSREKDLVLSYHIHSQLSPYYQGDPDRLRQILINLVGNALKFTETGEISVSVTPRNFFRSDGKHMLEVAVSDTGIGIRRERLETIFEPFTQADSSTARRFGGTGLGTTISRQLVERMGGEIWAESTVGKGSTFYFTACMEPAETCESISDDQNKGETRIRRAFKILIVEDVRENIMLAGIRLRKQGHTLLEAGNGYEAVRKYQREKPDIILMDVHMPEMDGIEATRRIRELEQASVPENGEKPEAVPIIALTASVMREEQEKCKKAGMNAVVGKPVDFDLLASVMEKLVPAGKGIRLSEGKNEEDCDLRGGQNFSGIDFHKGLKTWREPEIYLKVLRDFCMNYRGAAGELRRQLRNQDREAAFRTVHRLKGVAGNLCITEVYRISNELNAVIMEKEMEIIDPMIEALHLAVRDAVCVIREIKAEKKEDVCRARLPAHDLKRIFQDLLTSLQEYNPNAAEPFMEQLDQTLLPEQTAPIKIKIGQFDFDGVRDETVKLALSLGIKL